MTRAADANTNAKACRELIRSNPADAEAYWRLANIEGVRFEPGEIEAMHEHLAFDHVAGETRAQFLFALGKACEDDNDYTRAFRFYKEGNATRRAAESYDPRDTRTSNDRLIETFTRDLLERKAGQGIADAAPVFIVGMPHCGMALIEQILASHSQLDDVGELPALDKIVAGIDYPGSLPGADSGLLQNLGNAYLDAVAPYRGNARRFTDCTPTNFRHIGLISLVLPDAKVIDVQRHPIDSCIGVFTHLFPHGHPYSYDLAELGGFYLEYRRLMNHWHSVLPGKVLELQYEDLVAEPEPQTRRLLEHCGLDREDACFAGLATDRAIDTVDYWRHFEPELGELIQILRPLLDDLPGEP